MTLTITNNSSNQSIGSFDLTAPTGVTITSDAATTAPETSATVLAFRNLGIAPRTSKSYAISATTSPSASGTVTWLVQAKQSNDFNGPPGNDFMLTGGQPTTIVGCTLVWDVEPASAVHDQTITGQPYNPTIGHNNPAVTVKVTDGHSHFVTNVTGNVTLTSVGTGEGSDACGGFSGNTNVALTNGVATFGSLQSANVAFNCQLRATSPGFTHSEDSPPFNISLVGTLCGRTSCPSLNSDLNDAKDSGLTTSASGGTFQFMAFSPVTIGDHAGCANFDTLGVPGFDETDGNLSGTGTKTFRYFVSKVAYDKKFSDTRGQQFIPICAGGQRVVDGKRVDCHDEPQDSGWWGKSLDLDGNLLPGLAQAQCDDDGLWWGVLASFQDYNTLTPGPNAHLVDWSTNPSVTGWGSNSWSRYFDISVPNPWDWRAGT